MKLRMTQLVIVFPLVLTALSKGELVRDSVQTGETIRQEQNDFSKRIRHNREEAKKATKLSKVAIDRIKGNCIRTVDAATKQEGYYQPGAMVFDSKLKRKIRDGAFVCNSLGDTAVIEGGSISDIARVSLADKPQYDLLFKKGASANGKTSKSRK
jgi:hypothetical protein